MRHYRRIGPEVAFGESLVGLEHVQPIHDLAVGDALRLARAPKITFTDTRDTLAYSFYIQSAQEEDITIHERYVTVQLAHESEPDSWWMAVSRRTMNNGNFHSNRLERYRFEVFGEEVLEAKKAVFLILGSTALSVDAELGLLAHTATQEYRMYEKPLQVEDCETIQTMLSQTANRAAVSRR